MKTINFQVTHLSVACLLVILLIGGCKKELADDSTKLKTPDLLLSSEGAPVKKKVLRQSPGLKIEIKGETIQRIYPTLKNIDKITSILNEAQEKKNQGGVMTTQSANFTASLAGTYYNCYAELNDPGPYDWYLINWNTGVYTYIGSTTDYINFNVQKPSMYGSYRVWGEGPYGAGFTGYQYLGDPYVGVSKVSGVLEFTDVTALDNIITRLENAYEDHSSNFIDPLDYMSDDAITDYAQSVGFDEFLPFKEFEAFFGLYSLRQLIESEEIAWLNTADPWAASVYPDDKYAIEDDAERTINNQYGQVKVGGILFQPGSLIEFPDEEGPCSSEVLWCARKRTIRGTQDLPNNKKIHWKLTKKGAETESGGGVVFDSYFKGKIRRFRNSNGSWTKQMTRMSVQIIGTVRAWNGYNHCDLVYDTFDKTKSYKRRYMRDAKISWNQSTYIRSCEGRAIFTVDGTSFTKYLD